jgi:tRNA pseudouridine55 synthase
VRVLAADVGRALGCGAHLAALRRTQSGPFRIEQARSLAECAEAAASNKLEGELIPPAVALGFPVLAVSGEQQRRLQNGGDLASGELHREPPGTRVAIVDEAGQVLAVSELGADRRLWPLRVLAAEPG